MEFINFKQFFSRAKKYISRYAKSKTISKESLQSWLTNVIQMLQLVDNTYSKFSPTDRNQFKIKCMNNLPYVNDKFLKNFLKNYTRQLSNKALKLEKQAFLESFITTNSKLLKLMNNLDDKIDDFFKNDNIQIEQIRLSQLSILGIITEAQRFAEFTIYLSACLMDIAMLDPKERYKPDKYKVNLLEKYYSNVIKTVNNVCNKANNFTFLNDIKNTYNTSYDFTLGIIASNGNVLTSIINQIFKFPLTVQMGITQGLFGFGIISTVIDLYQQYMYNRYQQTKVLRDWMEQRVSLLKMELNDQMDPEKKERLEKIINNYEDLIAKYDRKIRDYEESIEEE